MPVSDDIVLNALADIRQPSLFGGALWSEALLALGIGMVLALAVAAILRIASEPRAAKQRPIGERIAALADLSLSGRLAALARLAQENGTPLPEDIRTALYRPMPESELAGYVNRLETDLLSR